MGAYTRRSTEMLGNPHAPAIESWAVVRSHDIQVTWHSPGSASREQPISKAITATEATVHNSDVSLCVVPSVGGFRNALFKIVPLGRKREQLAFSPTNFKWQLLLCCWSKTILRRLMCVLIYNLRIWQMIQDQQQTHSSSSSQSPGSSISVVLEAESCLVIVWISLGEIMCFVVCSPLWIDGLLLLLFLFRLHSTKRRAFGVNRELLSSSSLWKHYLIQWFSNWGPLDGTRGAAKNSRIWHFLKLF